jgi:hypothetical protein
LFAPIREKTIDYDAKIDDKASTLSESQLDQYYFDALTRVVVEDQSPYVRGYKIWEHEIEWRDHKITRRGYPECPKFTAKLTASNLKQPTEDVIRWLAGGVKNNLATAVLDGLELLDGEKLKPQRRRFGIRGEAA